MKPNTKYKHLMTDKQKYVLELAKTYGQLNREDGEVYHPSLEQFRTSPEEVEVSTPTDPWIKGCAQVGMVTFPLTVFIMAVKNYPLFSWQSFAIPLGMFALTMLAGKVVEKITKFNNR